MNDILVGLQHGDEGKGKVTKYLIKFENYDYCVRFNGGPNAGHTVYHNGKKFVTHQIPTGIFYNIKCLIGTGCVVDLNKLKDEIEKLETPLGRILINHDVLRTVKLLSLLEIKCGEELANMLGLETGSLCYGRTALIYCNGSPAIELLEIVSECPPTPSL